MITYVIGLAGSGKTSLAAKYASYYLKKGQNVYSNVPIIGTKELNPHNDFDNVNIHDGIILLDESAIDFNSRKFKTMPDNVNSFVRMHRHHHIDMYVFSQTYSGTDKLFRDMADIVILIRPSFYLPHHAYIRYYRHDIVPPDDLNPEFHDVFKLVLTKIRFMRYGKYTDLFDSFEAPLLPEKDWHIFNYTNRFQPSQQEKHSKLWNVGQFILAHSPGFAAAWLKSIIYQCDKNALRLQETIAKAAEKLPLTRKKRHQNENKESPIHNDTEAVTLGDCVAIESVTE